MAQASASKPHAWESKYDRVARLRQEIMEMHLLQLQQSVCEKDREKVKETLRALTLDSLLIDPLNIEACLDKFRQKYPERFPHLKPPRRKKLQRIEMECPQGACSPGDLIHHVLKDTGLPQREPVSRQMGCWAWDYSDLPSEVWDMAKMFLEDRIEKLYMAGIIRYGAWE